MSLTSGSATSHVLAVSSRCTTSPPTCKTDSATSAAREDHSWTLNLSTCVHGVFGGLRLADPGITTESTGLKEAQSRLVDLFTTASLSAVGWLSPDLFVVYGLSCESLLAQSPFSYFDEIWNARSAPAGELPQVSVLVPDELECDAAPRITEEEVNGKYVLPVPLQVMRHPIRVSELKGLKVAWERNPKCNVSTST